MQIELSALPHIAAFSIIYHAASYIYVYIYMHIYISFIIATRRFSTFVCFCFFSFSFFLSSLTCYQNCFFSIFTPHTLGEPNSLQSVWQAEGTQRWHRHARRQRSVRHRMMRMWSAIAVRMWSQISGFEKTRRH